MSADPGLHYPVTVPIVRQEELRFKGQMDGCGDGKVENWVTAAVTHVWQKSKSNFWISTY